MVGSRLKKKKRLTHDDDMDNKIIIIIKIILKLVRNKGS